MVVSWYNKDMGVPNDDIDFDLVTLSYLDILVNYIIKYIGLSALTLFNTFPIIQEKYIL